MNEIKKLILIIFLIVSFKANIISQTKNSLQEVLKTSVQNNQQIISARYNVEKQEALKLKAINIPKPQLFIEYEGIKGSLNNYEGRKIGIVQEFEFPSSYFLRSDMQNSQVLVSKAELDKLINDLKYEVKQNYYGLMMQIKLLEISKENLKIYTDFLFVAERKYNAGSASNLEVLGAKVNKIKFENEIKNVESQIKIYQAELKKLMNVDYNIIPSEVLGYREVFLDKINLLKNALTSNPELNSARFQREKSSNQISLSKSEILPNFSFRYYSQKLGSDGNFWGFEVGIGIPLWFWWEPSGNIKEANYEYKIASSDEVNIRKNIDAELNQSFEEYENSLRQVTFINNEALPESNEILRQAKISYEEGSIDYVEYLQTLTVWFDTNTLYINSIYNYNSSIIKLEKITAGDIQ